MSGWQYSTNGVNFVDFPTANAFSAATVFEAQTNSLAAIPGVNNKTNFAFRIVAEFESRRREHKRSNVRGRRRFLWQQEERSDSTWSRFWAARLWPAIHRPHLPRSLPIS